MSVIIGSLIEAWTQLRISKLRVLLSLVGVAASVAAMTFVIALGQVSVIVIQNEMARYSGYPGTVTVQVSPSSGESDGADESQATNSDSAGGVTQQASASQAHKVSKSMNDFVKRYKVQAATTSYETNIRFMFPFGPQRVNTTVVSASYNKVVPVSLSQGRWFSQADTKNLATPIVVNKAFAKELGIETLSAPFTVQSFTPSRTSFTIVGITAEKDSPNCYDDENGKQVCTQEYKAYVLRDPFEASLTDAATAPVPTLSMYVGREQVSKMQALAKREFGAQFGAKTLQVNSNIDTAASNSSMRTFTMVVSAAGVFMMVLGALGLINVSIVTVRQRIHEIGVRRAFGASSWRIFFSIMLESVVATVVAGIVGIAISILALRFVPLGPILGIQSDIPTPAYPFSAALIGLAAATGVGALAGIIPAWVAMRIKPIDAIRF